MGCGSEHETSFGSTSKVRYAIPPVVGATSGHARRPSRSGDRASTDVVRFGADDNSAVRATERAAVLWAVECAALVGGLLLLVHGRAAMQPDRASAVAAAATFVVVLVGSVLAAIVRIAPLRLAPLVPAVMVPGLTRSDSPRVAVLGFAAVALFPVAALYAARTRPWRWLSIALSVGALVTFGTRVLSHNPSAGLHCAPACMDNPWLRAHAPELLRGSEHVPSPCSPSPGSWSTPPANCGGALPRAPMRPRHLSCSPLPRCGRLASCSSRDRHQVTPSIAG